MSYFPYLGAIKSLVQMAFPDKMVSVWCEDTLLYPREILIKATVNDYWTYVRANQEEICTEWTRSGGINNVR